MSNLEVVSDKTKFPDMEDKLCQYWKDQNTFPKQLELSEGRPQFSFFDGPPFATGSPHHGHLLAGTIKDVVCRHACSSGKHVIRNAGWDTHGLPIEHIVDQIIEEEHGISSPQDIEKVIGIPAYNEKCRSMVMRYEDIWRKTIWRIGRWIDFEKGYKTMNKDYMESCWWVFEEIYKKGLVYEGVKVMPFSIACSTPLSNFEANLNYKDTSDTCVTVSFPLVDEPEVSLLAWTTTPWTLPSNLALCVNANMDYVKAQDKASGKVYILAKALTGTVWGKKKENFTILETFKGQELVGKRYTPLFDFFADYAKEFNAFRVVADNYVSEENGTGIVHSAPYFGEDDYRVCLEHGIINKDGPIICPVDNQGRMTAEVGKYSGILVKKHKETDSIVDPLIIADLKANDRIVNVGTVKHSYPFCYRSETALIYKAVPSWFIAVEKIKDSVVRNNLAPQTEEEFLNPDRQQPAWVPRAIQEKRFHNWLVNARDWAVSRNRLWGLPLPIWRSEDKEITKVYGNVADLEDAAGLERRTLKDLHRDHVDGLTIPDPRGDAYPPLQRVPEVFDCWFESGAMPYAQLHYPFENKELFEQTFPADFIAEGLDQTRGWFYTLNVLSAALFDKAPFLNCIVNGLILDPTGKKLSKSKKNYTPPDEIMETYGADALRLYLMNSPGVHAESLRFRDDGVEQIVLGVLRPWWSAYRFFVQNARRAGEDFNWTPMTPEQALEKCGNVMDKWILASLAQLVDHIKFEMTHYALHNVVPKVINFINILTNSYVRLNRSRMKGSEGRDEQEASLSIMYAVLINFCKAACPFTPFITEEMWLNLRKLDATLPESVHFTLYPELDSLKDSATIRKIDAMLKAVELGRKCREAAGLGLQQPLQKVIFCHFDKQTREDLTELSDYLKGEIKVKEVFISDDEAHFAQVVMKPDMAILGRRLGKNARSVVAALSERESDLSLINEVRRGNSITLAETVIEANEIILNVAPRDLSAEHLFTAADGALLSVVDTQLTEELKEEGEIIKIISFIQKLRKSVNLEPEDKIHIFFDAENAEFVKKIKEQVVAVTRALSLTLGKPDSFVASKEYEGAVKMDIYVQLA